MTHSFDEAAHGCRTCIRPQAYRQCLATYAGTLTSAQIGAAATSSPTTSLETRRFFSRLPLAEGSGKAKRAGPIVLSGLGAGAPDDGNRSRDGGPGLAISDHVSA